VKEAAGLRLIADYPFNVFNSYSLNMLDRLNISGATLSPELTLRQITEFNRSTPLSLEAVVYGRIPLMTSEYCPVGSLKGNAGTVEKCEGVCRGGTYRLKDRKGMEFPVLCDRVDCRSMILNSNVLFVPGIVDKLKEAGVDMIRLYVYDETPMEAREIIDMYKDLADNGAGSLDRYHGMVERIKAGGFTKGHYFRGGYDCGC